MSEIHSLEYYVKLGKNSGEWRTIYYSYDIIECDYEDFGTHNPKKIGAHIYFYSDENGTKLTGTPNFFVNAVIDNQVYPLENRGNGDFYFLPNKTGNWTIRVNDADTFLGITNFYHKKIYMLSTNTENVYKVGYFHIEEDEYDDGYSSVGHIESFTPLNEGSKVFINDIEHSVNASGEIELNSGLQGADHYSIVSDGFCETTYNFGLSNNTQSVSGTISVILTVNNVNESYGTEGIFTPDGIVGVCKVKDSMSLQPYCGELKFGNYNLNPVNGDRKNYAQYNILKSDFNGICIFSSYNVRIDDLLLDPTGYEPVRFEDSFNVYIEGNDYNFKVDSSKFDFTYNDNNICFKSVLENKRITYLFGYFYKCDQYGNEIQRLNTESHTVELIYEADGIYNDNEREITIPCDSNGYYNYNLKNPGYYSLKVDGIVKYEHIFTRLDCELKLDKSGTNYKVYVYTENMASTGQPGNSSISESDISVNGETVHTDYKGEFSSEYLNEGENIITVTGYEPYTLIYDSSTETDDIECIVDENQSVYINGRHYVIADYDVSTPGELSYLDKSSHKNDVKFIVCEKSGDKKPIVNATIKITGKGSGKVVILKTGSGGVAILKDYFENDELCEYEVTYSGVTIKDDIYFIDTLIDCTLSSDTVSVGEPIIVTTKKVYDNSLMDGVSVITSGSTSYDGYDRNYTDSTGKCSVSFSEPGFYSIWVWKEGCGDIMRKIVSVTGSQVLTDKVTERHIIRKNNGKYSFEIYAEQNGSPLNNGYIELFFYDRDFADAGRFNTFIIQKMNGTCIIDNLDINNACYYSIGIKESNAYDAKTLLETRLYKLVEVDDFIVSYTPAKPKKNDLITFSITNGTNPVSEVDFKFDNFYNAMNVTDSNGYTSGGFPLIEGLSYSPYFLYNNNVYELPDDIYVYTNEDYNDKETLKCTYEIGEVSSDNKVNISVTVKDSNNTPISGAIVDVVDYGYKGMVQYFNHQSNTPTGSDGKTTVKCDSYVAKGINKTMVQTIELAVFADGYKTIVSDVITVSPKDGLGVATKTMDTFTYSNEYTTFDELLCNHISIPVNQIVVYPEGHVDIYGLYADGKNVGKENVVIKVWDYYTRKFLNIDFYKPGDMFDDNSSICTSYYSKEPLPNGKFYTVIYVNGVKNPYYDRGNFTITGTYDETVSPATPVYLDEDDNNNIYVSTPVKKKLSLSYSSKTLTSDNEEVSVSVTDYNSNDSLEGILVELVEKDNNDVVVASAYTESNGVAKMRVPAGSNNSLVAIANTNNQADLYTTVKGTNVIDRYVIDPTGDGGGGTGTDPIVNPPGGEESEPGTGGGTDPIDNPNPPDDEESEPGTGTGGGNTDKNKDKDMEETEFKGRTINKELLSGEKIINRIENLTDTNNVQYTIVPKLQAAYGFSDMGVAVSSVNESFINADSDPTFLTTHKIGYEDRDRYAIGEETCNSFLFMSPINHRSVQVDGDTLESGKSIKGGESLRVPIVYQYRMSDFEGKIFGKYPEGSEDLNEVKNTKYANIIGIDIWSERNALIPKQYDIVVYSTYGSTLTVNTSKTKTTTQTLVDGGRKIAIELEKLSTDSKTDKFRIAKDVVDDRFLKL